MTEVEFYKRINHITYLVEAGHITPDEAVRRRYIARLEFEAFDE